MKFWSRFDRKVALVFTGNVDSRLCGIKGELFRVGMEDAFVQWQFPNPIERLILRRIQHVPNIEKRGYMNCTMGHYMAISTSYHMGCGSVLIMEDDVRFAKDISFIEEAVCAIPEDYDIAMLDYFYRSWKDVWSKTADKMRNDRKANEYWAEFDRFHSGACYALSRNGMKKMLELYESPANGSKSGILRICDGFMDRRFFGSDARMYFAIKNIAIQRQFCSGNSNGHGIPDPYDKTGIDISEYAEA